MAKRAPKHAVGINPLRGGRNLCMCLVGLLVVAAHAADAPPDPLAGRPAPELDGLDVVEHLGERLPLDLTFTDSAGRSVRLGDLVTGDKPLILNLGYYECPMLCGLVLDGLVKSTKRIGWTPGTEYDIVTVSINPTEKPKLAAVKKQGVMSYLDKAGAEAGWHFLVGDKQNTEALAAAAGFGYRWDEVQKQYAHPAVIMVLTPQGILSRYLYYGNSASGEPFASQTLRLSMVEAADGKVGSPIDHVLLYCFQWDASRGVYSMVAMNMMRLGGAVTVVVVGSAIGLMLFREHRRKNRIEDPQMNTDEP